MQLHMSWCYASLHVLGTGPATSAKRASFRLDRPGRAFSADIPHWPKRSDDLWRLTVDSEAPGDVIDLGAPRDLRLAPRHGPKLRCSHTTRAYTPNPRLYPGPPRTSGQRNCTPSRGRNRKVFRHVPNSRLYKPPPPRPVPPPAIPRTTWRPPAPALALDTASHAALCLSQNLRFPPKSSVQHSDPRNNRRVVCNPKIQTKPKQAVTLSTASGAPRLVVLVPAAAGDGGSKEASLVRHYQPASQHFRDRELSSPCSSGDSSAPHARYTPLRGEYAMDSTPRHSTSPEDCSEGNDSLSAPSEFLAEFLSAIMRRQYAEALKYCRLILQYEPRNATARGFYPLLQQKLLQSPRAARARHAPGTKARTPRRRDAPHNRSSPTPDVGGSSAGDSGPSSPTCHPTSFLAHEVMELDADSLSSPFEDSARSAASSVEPEPEPERGFGSVSSQSSLELDSSDAPARSSPSLLAPSRRTDRTACTDRSDSASASGTWDSSGSARDDNGNPAPAHTPPLSCCDADNNTEPVRSPRAPHRPPPHVSDQSTESLRRLRAQFACSIK